MRFPAPDRLQTAHADMWQLEGALRAGCAELRDVRLASSGLRETPWNNADVHGPDPDLAGARDFFGDLPWGARVPAGARFPHGEHRLRVPLMDLRPRDFAAAPRVPGLAIREAGATDLDAVARVDATAFGFGFEQGRRWLAAHLGPPEIRTLIGFLDGEPVAHAFSIRTDGWAGPALYLGGVGVLPQARRRGIGAAISSALLEDPFEYAHLWPDTPGAARIYDRLGFRHGSALDVYVRIAP